MQDLGFTFKNIKTNTLFTTTVKRPADCVAIRQPLFKRQSNQAIRCPNNGWWPDSRAIISAAMNAALNHTRAIA